MSAITLALKKLQKKQEEQKNGTDVRTMPQGSGRVQVQAGNPYPATPPGQVVIPPSDYGRNPATPGSGGTMQQIMQRYTGNPYTALTDSDMNRQGAPQDLSFWYTYGAGPEYNYFTDNTAAAPTTPKPPGTTPNVPGKTPITIPNLGGMGGPLAGLQIPQLQQLLAQYQGGTSGGRTQTMQPVKRARGGPLSVLRDYR